MLITFLIIGIFQNGFQFYIQLEQIYPYMCKSIYFSKYFRLGVCPIAKEYKQILQRKHLVQGFIKLIFHMNPMKDQENYAGISQFEN